MKQDFYIAKSQNYDAVKITCLTVTENSVTVIIYTALNTHKVKHQRVNISQNNDSDASRHDQ